MLLCWFYHLILPHIQVFELLKHIELPLYLRIQIGSVILIQISSVVSLQGYFIFYPGSPQQYVWIFNVPSFNDTGEVKIPLWSFCLVNFNKDMPPWFFGLYLKNNKILQGKGEFSMEYKEHSIVSNEVQTQLVNGYKTTKGAE